MMLTANELRFVHATAEVDLVWLGKRTWVERLDAGRRYRDAEDGISGYPSEVVRDLRELGHLHGQWLRRARRGLGRG